MQTTAAFVLKSTDPYRPGYFAAEDNEADGEAFYYLDQNVQGRDVSQWTLLRHAQMAQLVSPANLPRFQVKQIVTSIEEFDV